MATRAGISGPRLWMTVLTVKNRTLALKSAVRKDLNHQFPRMISRTKLKSKTSRDIHPVAAEQDFYATTFLTNLAAVVEADAQVEAQERFWQSPHPYKYTESRINRNILVGTIKNWLNKVVLEPDPDQRDRAFQRVTHHLQRALISARRGRKAPRRKEKNANKYAQNRRRCL